MVGLQCKFRTHEPFGHSQDRILAAFVFFLCDTCPFQGGSPCTDQFAIPHFCDARNLPLYMGGSVFGKPFFVVSQKKKRKNQRITTKSIKKQNISHRPDPTRKKQRIKTGKKATSGRWLPLPGASPICCSEAAAAAGRRLAAADPPAALRAGLHARRKRAARVAGARDLRLPAAGQDAGGPGDGWGGGRWGGGEVGRWGGGGGGEVGRWGGGGVGRWGGEVGWGGGLVGGGGGGGAATSSPQCHIQPRTETTGMGLRHPLKHEQMCVGGCMERGTVRGRRGSWGFFRPL